MSKIGQAGEFNLIAQWTRGLAQAEGDLLGLGDDCAVLRLGDRVLLVSTDASVEGVHFDFRWCSPEDAGWRAMAGAISDIAAMGGAVIGAMISLALPHGLKEVDASALYAGLRGAAEAHGAAILGGDTTRSPSGIFIDITVLGEALDGRYCTRGGARGGDVLAVTGWPGRSAAALGAYLKAGHKTDLPEAVADAHLRPCARLEAGRWLALQPAVHALIDVSDGILQDARHLVERSGVGVHIDARGEVEDELLRDTCAAQGLDAHACYWGGGEDYELLVAVDAEAFPDIARAHEQQFGLPLRRIGVFEGETLRVEGAPNAEGFDHFRAGDTR